MRCPSRRATTFPAQTPVIDRPGAVWWHGYRLTGAHESVDLFTVIGPSRVPPGEAPAFYQGVTEGVDLHFAYVLSWDHRPTHGEKQAALG